MSISSIPGPDVLAIKLAFPSEEQYIGFAAEHWSHEGVPLDLVPADGEAFEEPWYLTYVIRDWLRDLFIIVDGDAYHTLRFLEGGVVECTFVVYSDLQPLWGDGLEPLERADRTGAEEFERDCVLSHPHECIEALRPFASSFAFVDIVSRVSGMIIGGSL